ncbi:MAG: glycosyltransferase [Deltaproteobacteria bacterium]|nr:glycosyltransferase [Deltaproteobacteria bacterium]
MSSLTIIIPTYNRGDELARTLDSMNRIEVPPGVRLELFVVNNNCTDETPEVVARAAKSAAISIRHLTEHKKGASAARNRGIHESSSEHLAFFDDDVRIEPKWIQRYFEAIQELSVDCVVGPVDPLLNVQLPPFINDSVLRSLSAPYSHKGDRPFVLDTRVAHELPGCNFGITKRAVMHAGCFDEHRGPMGRDWRANEDFELGRRVVAAGYRTGFHPGCRVRHLIGDEKLNRAHLRRRWSEAGRVLRELDPRGDRATKRVRSLMSAARLAGRAGFSYARGDRAAGFEAELGALKALRRALP